MYPENFDGWDITKRIIHIASTGKYHARCGKTLTARLVLSSTREQHWASLHEQSETRSTRTVKATAMTQTSHVSPFPVPHTVKFIPKQDVINVSGMKTKAS